MKRFIFTCFLFGIIIFYENVSALSKIYLNVLGTSIDEIVVQGNDNSYYLNHNALNNKDIKGATFLDYRNNINDQKIIIYGHNSNNLEVPFKELEKYYDYDFYKSHKYIFLTVGENTNIYKIFSVMITGTNEHTRLGFSNNNYYNHLKYLVKNSLYETGTSINKNSDILVIQTCNYKPLNTFIVVSAKKLKGEIYEAL